MSGGATYLHLTRDQFEPLIPSRWIRDRSGYEHTYHWAFAGHKHHWLYLLSSVDVRSGAFRESGSDAIRIYTLDHRLGKPRKLRSGPDYVARSGSPASLERRMRLALLSEAAELLAIPACPQCGLVMVKRSGARGTFYGCIAYPNCRGTRPWSMQGLPILTSGDLAERSKPQAPLSSEALFEKASIEEERGCFEEEEGSKLASTIKR